MWPSGKRICYASMPASSDKPPFEQIVKLLAEHGVSFVVIGGRAENLLGSPRLTIDTDLCYERSAENLNSLAAALEKIHPTLRGAPEGLPFRADAATLRA